MEKRGSGGGFLWGFLLGAVLGSVAMLFLLPQPDESAQGPPATPLDALRARIRERVEAVLAEGKGALEEGRRAADELREEFDAALDAAQRQ